MPGSQPHQNDAISNVRPLIERMPICAEFKADEELAREFFRLSEDESLPDALRDFCLDLSLCARADETGPLRLADTPTLVAKLECISDGRRTRNDRPPVVP